jgi:hypothetical protein
LEILSFGLIAGCERDVRRQQQTGTCCDEFVEHLSPLRFRHILLT